MTRTELKNEAKEQIKGKIGILFLIFLKFFIKVNSINFIRFFIFQNFPREFQKFF